MSHSKYAPSASSRWMDCTASISAIAELPPRESEESAYAAEGTDAHEIGAHLLETHPLVGNQEDRQAEMMLEAMDRPQEMLRYCESYASYCMEFHDRSEDTFVIIEQPVELFYGHNRGTADCVMYCAISKTLHIFDLKYGKGVKVDADHNSQLLIYLASWYSQLVDSVEIDKCVIHVVQPRLQHFDNYEISPDNLVDFMMEVQQTVEGIEAGNTQFSPSQSNCRWCPVSGQCRGEAAEAMSVFEDLESVGVEVEDNPAENLDLLERHDIVQFLGKRKFITQWLEAVQAVAYNMLEQDPASLPEYKLVEGRSVRKWADEEAAMKLCRNHFKVDELYKKKALSPSQVETLIKQKNINPSSRWNNKFKTLVEKPAGKPTIAPACDPRPAIASATEDFEDLATPEGAADNG